MNTDPIADMLTRFRNGYLVKKTEVSIPFSKIKLALSEVLVSHGYLQGIEETGEGKEKVIKCKLLYKNGQSAVKRIVRVSMPGRRVYWSKRDLKAVLFGLGLGIVTTSKGIMTVGEAKKLGVGGELICQVW